MSMYAFDSIADQQLSRHQAYLDQCHQRFEAAAQAVQAEDLLEQFTELLIEAPESIELWLGSMKADQPLSSTDTGELFSMLLALLEEAFELCRRREVTRLREED
jgi:hypothetical protein